MKKYRLTKNKKRIGNITLYQIQALKDFAAVKEGDLGGWIEKEDNLSQEGNCWVYDDAKVFGNAYVYGNAKIYGNAEVYGNAHIFEKAEVYDNARVSGSVYVFDSARVYGHALVSDNAWVTGNAQVSGYTQISGDVRLFAKAKFTKGLFKWATDKDRITEITDKTGTDYWKHQYVLGEYKIEPLNDESDKQDTEFIDIDGKQFSKDTIKEALRNYTNKL